MKRGMFRPVAVPRVTRKMEARTVRPCVSKGHAR